MSEANSEVGVASWQKPPVPRAKGRWVRSADEKLRTRWSTASAFYGTHIYIYTQMQEIQLCTAHHTECAFESNRAICCHTYQSGFGHQSAARCPAMDHPPVAIACIDSSDVRESR